MLVLVVNCGSSSLKYQLFDTETEHDIARGLIERIGEARSPVRHSTDTVETRTQARIADHRAAVLEMTRLLCEGEGKVIDSVDQIEAIGHRVVHGGEDFLSAVLVDHTVIGSIERNASLAPLHNPANLAGIRACREVMWHKPNVAVFDTAFHLTMPQYAYLYAIPRQYYNDLGVRRYGFHGTSHYYVSVRAREMLNGMGRDGDSAKMVTCHLGNGCSMAAVDGGRCVDTTMGLTPLEGCVMGTRSGDVDPALIPFLGRKLGLSFDQVDAILNKKSGLLGLSGVSNDLRDVLAAARDGNVDAREAFEVFCYRIRKYIGAYAAAMSGLDAIVFTAGIGENSAEVREEVCRWLGFLGVELDPEAQTGSGDRLISAPSSRCAVFVIGTKEELVIARETERVVSGNG
jgi:acetate kinase